MPSLALPMGGQLQLNGALLSQPMHDAEDSGEDAPQACGAQGCARSGRCTTGRAVGGAG